MLFWVAVALAVLAVAYLGISLFVAIRFTAPNRQPAEHTPADMGLVYREVSFESTDGVPLAAWWVPPADEGMPRAAVLVHGWGGDKSDRHVIETAQIYARAGYGVLLLDLRGNGDSGGERSTLGYTETHDVRGMSSSAGGTHHAASGTPSVLSKLTSRYPSPTSDGVRSAGCRFGAVNLTATKRLMPR